MKTRLSQQWKRTQSQWALFHPPPPWMSGMGTQLLVDIPPGTAPGKFDRPVTHGLVEVGSEASCGWEDSENISGVDAFRGCPVMGSKLYPTGWTHHRKAGRQ